MNLLPPDDKPERAGAPLATADTPDTPDTIDGAPPPVVVLVEVEGGEDGTPMSCFDTETFGG